MKCLLHVIFTNSFTWVKVKNINLVKFGSVKIVKLTCSQIKVFYSRLTSEVKIV